MIYNREAAANPLSPMQARALTSQRGSSTGLLVFRTAFLRAFPWTAQNGPLSIYREILARPLQQDTFHAYDNGMKFFIDVGTENTWKHMQQYPEQYQQLLQYDAENRA